VRAATSTSSIASIRIARRGERIALAALPDVSVAVDELLPPAETGDLG